MMKGFGSPGSGWRAAATGLVLFMAIGEAPLATAKRLERGGQAIEALAPPPSDQQCAPPRCLVRLQGRGFTRDGLPWIPKGAVITGFVAPEGYRRGTYAKARQQWGDLLLGQLRAVGVDTVRITVGAAGLDPRNPMADGKMDPARKRAYLDEIVAAVALAERHGMVSIVNVTTGGVTGYPSSEETPGPEAARAWSVLAPALANRPSVMFDAFNEPGFGGGNRIDDDASPWKAWRLGYQLMVDTIRQSGARNVIILDGISVSRVWRRNAADNVPKDPLGQLAFDIHPYPTDASLSTKGGKSKLDYFRTADVERNLDGWCDRHACVATEFFSGVSNNPDKANCYDERSPTGASSPRLVRDFLTFFRERGIGVFVFTGDWAHRLMDHPGERGARLTSFEGFAGCRSGDKNAGPGELFSEHWRLQRAAERAPR